MRVRKRTSKRTSTRLREGIRKKATAHRRKQGKLAKKDPTWKSRMKKDPGIPANFPYKAEILEQIEAKKRQEVAERELAKQQRLEARRAALEAGESLMDEESEMEDDGANGLAALVESAQQAAAVYEGDDENMDEEDEENYDTVEYDIGSDIEDASSSTLEKSRKAYDKIFKSVVDASDVILYVLDARDPEGTRSRKVEQAVLQSQGKRLILILNKVDLVPPHVLEQWLNVLKSSFPTIPIKAAPGATDGRSFNKKLTQTVTANALLECLKKYSANSNLRRSIVVGVIGYPNVGKSSVINALLSRHGKTAKACPVGNQAGVTTSLREVKVDDKLKILDSPGICFPGDGKKKSKADYEAELVLLNALPMKFVVDPYPAVLKLVKRVSKSDEMTESFKSFYKLPPLPSSDPDSFTKHFLIHIARVRGRLGKGGVPNLASAGISVLNDWRDGKILGWVMPKTSKLTDQPSEQSTIKSDGKRSQSSTVEQTKIVAQWSKEFDLDGLFNSLDKCITESGNSEKMQE